MEKKLPSLFHLFLYDKKNLPILTNHVNILRKQPLTTITTDRWQTIIWNHDKDILTKHNKILTNLMLKVEENDCLMTEVYRGRCRHFKKKGFLHVNQAKKWGGVGFQLHAPIQMDWSSKKKGFQPRNPPGSALSLGHSSYMSYISLYRWIRSIRYCYGIHL